jgi:AcrR family transcriptional regulator
LVSDEEIFDKAREVFTLHGFHVSTTAIADAVGLSAPALFKRFGTKEALFLQAMAPDAPPSFVSTCLRGPDHRPIRTQLLELAREIHGFFVVMAPRLSVIHTSGCGHKFFDHLPEPPPILAFRALCSFFEQAQTLGLLRDQVRAGHLAEMFLSTIAYRQASRALMGPSAPEWVDDDDCALGSLVAILTDSMVEATP